MTALWLAVIGVAVANFAGALWFLRRPRKPTEEGRAGYDAYRADLDKTRRLRALDDMPREGRDR